MPDPHPLSSDPAWFTTTAPAYVQVGPTKIAYRRIGNGPPLILIHGWPFTSYTYSKITPYLAQHFTCYLPDSPGLGLSEWSEGTDFSFPGQARTFQAFIDALGIGRYSMIAHDTGASVARLMAAAAGERLEKFIILNTEIPGERPPWFPLYRKLMFIPGFGGIFRLFLRSETFLKSSMGFGGCFNNPNLIDEQFRQQYIVPLLEDDRRLEGAFRYLKDGLDFSLIDSMPRIHAQITAPVLLIWGAADPTFSVAGARRMVAEFPHAAGLVEIKNGKLLVHEEFPEEVARVALEFLLRKPSS